MTGGEAAQAAALKCGPGRWGMKRERNGEEVEEGALKRGWKKIVFVTTTEVTRRTLLVIIIIIITIRVIMVITGRAVAALPP